MNNEQAPKPDVAPLDTGRKDYSALVNFSDITGFIETATAAPSAQIPTNVYDQLKYYNGALYFYDTATSVWVPIGGYFTGVVVPFGGNPGAGWQGCTGGAISRTTFAALFAVIGTTFGAGDGSTTFNVPNIQGRVVVGIGGSGVVAIGNTGGEQNHTLTSSEIPSHVHSMGAFFSGAGSGTGTAGGAVAPSVDTNTKANTGGDGSHNNMQPYIGMNYYIKT